jgi:hypothetical protein
MGDLGLAIDDSDRRATAAFFAAVQNEGAAARRPLRDMRKDLDAVTTRTSLISNKEHRASQTLPDKNLTVLTEASEISVFSDFNGGLRTGDKGGERIPATVPFLPLA